MPTKLIGDAARRGLLEYWKQRDRRNELQARIAHFRVQIAEIKRGPRTFDAAMRLMTAQEQIAALSPDAFAAAATASRLAEQLGIDENPAPPPRYRGPVKIGTPAARPVRVAPAKRTLPSGFLTRMIGGSGCR